MNLQAIQNQIHNQPMGNVQKLVVILCSMVNMIDGFDILAASFISPIVAREWGLGPEALGVLFSAGPAGMAVGALFLSPIADLFGRRTSIIMCLSLMSIGMLFSSMANSVEVLTALRFITGLGVGAMASCTGTLVFEFSPKKSRNFGIGMVTIGYPFGAVVGGIISVWLISSFGWRSIFIFGGCASAIMIPIIYFKMPESLEFIIARRPKNALEKVNKILQRLGMDSVDSLPEANPDQASATKKSGSLLNLLRPPILNRLLMMGGTYFLYMLSSYFILNWANQLTTDAGFSDTNGLSIAILLNLGGIAGGVVVGLLTMRLGLKAVAMSVMALMGFATIAFGIFGNSLVLIAITSMLMGFGIFGAAVALYATAANTFPASVRATGIGLSMSAGRVGSVVGPYLAGVLLAADVGRIGVCILLALPVLFAAIAITRIPLEPASPEANADPGLS